MGVKGKPDTRAVNPRNKRVRNALGGIFTAPPWQRKLDALATENLRIWRA